MQNDTRPNNIDSAHKMGLQVIADSQQMNQHNFPRTQMNNQGSQGSSYQDREDARQKKLGKNEYLLMAVRRDGVIEQLCLLKSCTNYSIRLHSKWNQTRRTEENYCSTDDKLR